jgi:hypothetical protein
MAAAGLVLVTIWPTLPQEFKEDREKMVPGLRLDALAAQAPHAKNQFRTFCQSLEHQLGGRSYILGETFSLADASCFQALWFARMDPTAAGIIGTFPALGAWFARVETLGHGDARPLDPDEALAIAAKSESATAPCADTGDPNGAAPGDRVTVTPDDYALDPVAGEIVALTSTDVAIRRRDPAVGEVVVHFPRGGFRLAAA